MKLLILQSFCEIVVLLCLVLCFIHFSCFVCSRFSQPKWRPLQAVLGFAAEDTEAQHAKQNPGS